MDSSILATSFSVVFALPLIFFILFLAVSELASFDLTPSQSRPALIRDLGLIFLVSLIVALSSAPGAALQVSDSLEYFWMALNFSHHGVFGISPAGEMLPSRFSPFFSAFFVFPVLIIDVDPWKFASLFEFLFPFLCLVTLYFAVQDRKPALRVALALAPLALAEFRYYSPQILTDSLCAAFLVFVFLFPTEDRCSRILLATAAFFIAVLRIYYAPLAVALLLLRLGGRGVIWGIPVFCLLAIELQLNYRLFGDPIRTGYSFWMSVPYDRTSRVFSPEFFTHNLAALFSNNSVLATLLVWSGALILNRSRRKELLLTGSVAGILTLFHLFYFYFSVRLYLPAVLLLLVVSLCALGELLPQRVTKIRHISLIATFVCILLIVFSQGRNESLQVAELEELKTLSPDTVISSANPLLIRLVTGPQLTVVPFDREVEYASKVLTPNRPSVIFNSQPNPFNHRHPSLLENGGVEVFEQTFSELSAPEQCALISSGGATYMHAGLFDSLSSDLSSVLRKENAGVSWTRVSCDVGSL